MAKVSMTLSDAYGRTTKRLYEVESQVDLATYGSVIESFVTDLEAVSDLGVLRADLIIPMTLGASPPAEGANVDVGATASGFLDIGGGKKASMKIPGISAALVSSDGTVPIVGAVADWLANFETAGAWRLSDGEQIESWIRATLDR